MSDDPKTVSAAEASEGDPIAADWLRQALADARAEVNLIPSLRAELAETRERGDRYAERGARWTLECDDLKRRLIAAGASVERLTTDLAGARREATDLRGRLDRIVALLAQRRKCGPRTMDALRELATLLDPRSAP